MKKYIKAAGISVDTDIEYVSSATFPYVLELAFSLPEAISVESSREPEISIAEDIFEYPEYLSYFAQMVSDILSSKYNVSTAALKINENHDSVYLPAVQRVGNSLIEVRAEIGYLLRISNHSQNLPYSEEATQARETTKESLIEFVKRIFTRTHKDTRDITMKFPDIDYSITVLCSMDDSDNLKTKSLEDAAEYIAADMYDYICEEAKKLANE